MALSTSEPGTGLTSGVGRAVSGLAAVVALSAAGVAGWSVASGAVSPFLVMFEGVTLLAAYFGWRIGRGKHAEGASIGLLCVAGAIASAALLGYVGSNGNISGVSLKPYLIGRVAAGALFGLAAAWAVLSGRPKELLPGLVRGLVFGAVLVGVVAATYVLRGQVMALHPVLCAGVLLAVGVLSLGLLAASVHYCVRAFEMGTLPKRV